MATGAAIILALSLVLCGLAILGDALGWLDLPGDFWVAVIALLGSAGRFATDRTAKRKKAAESRPPNAKAPPRADLLLVVLALPLLACAGTPAGAAAERWAICAGAGALHCIPAAGGESLEDAAVGYAACLAHRAVTCAAPIARPNPPTHMDDVDLACVADVASRCLHEARTDAATIGRSASRACVRGRISRCLRGGRPDAP